MGEGRGTETEDQGAMSHKAALENHKHIVAVPAIKLYTILSHDGWPEGPSFNTMAESEIARFA